ncbi:MAG: hypothetical protein AAGB15_13090, partial [Pseudomonadota bacterium]
MAKTVLLIAMPTQGDVATPTVKALIGLTQALARKGVPFAFETYEFSDIVFSRNQLLSIFHTREQFTHMLFLDSDMAFQPDAIFRLIDFGADFAVTAYPQKHPKWTAIRQGFEAEMAKPEEERASIADVLSGAWTYNHQIAQFGGGAWQPEERDGFVTVPAAGTGMMLLSRAVPETMVAKGAAVEKPRMSQVPLHKGLKYHDYFSHLSSPDGGLMYGEDQSFCMRWTHMCGGTIWMDTQSLITHHGAKSFSGRYEDALARD